MDDKEIIAQWVRAAQAGDTQAFEKIVLHFQDRVWRRVRFRLKNEEDASDVTQDILITCFRKIGQFRGESSFWGWLQQVADNHVKNYVAFRERRGHSRTQSLGQPVAGTEGDDPIYFDPPDSSAGPRKQAEDWQAREALGESIDRLSPEHREIIQSYFFDGLSYEGIAEKLGAPLGTVKSRINRARAELREMMKNHLT